MRSLAELMQFIHTLHVDVIDAVDDAVDTEMPVVRLRKILERIEEFASEHGDECDAINAWLSFHVISIAEYDERVIGVSLRAGDEDNE